VRKVSDLSPRTARDAADPRDSTLASGPRGCSIVSARAAIAASAPIRRSHPSPFSRRSLVHTASVALFCAQFVFAAQVARGQCAPPTAPSYIVVFGVCWTFENGHRKDLRGALRREAANGDAMAAATLGDCFVAEDGLLSKYFAAKWYLKAAQLGNVDSQAKIGEMYEFGEGVWANHDKAVTWVHNAIEGHDLNIATTIGDRYLQSSTNVSPLKLPAKIRKALFWYHVAADAGDKAAMLAIGQIWFNRATIRRPAGTIDDSVQDFSTASVWFRLTADTFGPAALSLGYQYAKGLGLPQSDSEALRWYRKAGELGMGYQSLETFLEQHPNVPRDMKGSLEVYHQDRRSAQTTFFLFEKMFRASDNYVDELALYRTRADSGDAVAQEGLGLRYEYGIGVPRNWLAAYALYSRAAMSTAAVRQSLPDFTKYADPQRLAVIRRGFGKEGQDLLIEMAKPGNLLKALDEFVLRRPTSTDPVECDGSIQY
jgi:TPR repeat protein